MGWFWSDGPVTAATAVAPHPIPRDASLSPPPGCPMHQKGADSLKPKPPPSKTESACPYTPIDISKTTSPTTSTYAKYNPLNFMFSDLSQERATTQKVALDTEREPSTIPRGSGDGNWEYPSPQQMYNALLRKGYADTDPEHVTSMVSVHNFLNEGAWKEVRVWEGLFSQGLAQGWRRASMGDQGLAEAFEAGDEPSLMRFQGRPKDMTPKAAIQQALGWLYPSKYETKPPFDRHDWYVQRVHNGQIKEIRYVIDYYEAPDDENGDPVFNLDVRPAVDSPILAMERIARWGGEVWYKASGAQTRENPQMQRN